MTPALLCQPPFSFLEGASALGELAERAVDLVIPAIALIDREGVPHRPFVAWVETATALVVGNGPALI